MPAALAIDSLSVRFRGGAGIVAVREVSLAVNVGECLAIVGESGSGKTQTFMAVMGLLPKTAQSAGSVRFGTQEILNLPAADLNRIRGSKLTMIFQDPMSSLTPHLRIGVQLAEVLVAHTGCSWQDAERTARDTLARVHVPEPERRLKQYPFELSGGLRQRVMIAMSLLCDPTVVIADEPTTSLDVRVQAEILGLLDELRTVHRTAVVLVSHDLAVVAQIADRILVMYAGRIVESGAVRELLRLPEHPYTAELLRCVPSIRGPLLARMHSLRGSPPRAVTLTEEDIGCAFAPRCARARERCRTERPVLEDSRRAGRWVACHYPLSP